MPHYNYNHQKVPIQTQQMEAIFACLHPHLNSSIQEKDLQTKVANVAGLLDLMKNMHNLKINLYSPM